MLRLDGRRARWFIGGLVALLTACGSSAVEEPFADETGGGAGAAGASAGGSAGSAGTKVDGGKGGGGTGGAPGTGGAKPPADSGTKADQQIPAGVSVTVAPQTASVATGGKVQLTANVTGTGDTSVTWSVEEGASGGAVSGSGEYTAPATAGTYHVVAKSNADATRTARATITVKEPITDLPVGVWTDVTPPGSLGATGVYHLAITPSNPAIVYVASDKEGMWKTTDSAKTWARLGNPNGYFTNGTTDYLDDPCQVSVDPDDPNHIYATEGVNGGRDGFWISHDGGNTWVMPQGFKDVGAKVGGAWFDVVMMSVDPSDFKHVIVSTHSDWQITAGYSSGIYETRDGGDTFTYHLPPNDVWSAGTKGIHILSHPESGTGNGDTWLICDEGAGFWRTTDAGASWNKVSNTPGPHGGNQSYYTKTGVLYVAANNQPVRSTDNGATWETLSNLPGNGYSAIIGTGTTLYAHGTEFNCTAAWRFKVSPETDGKTWTDDTAQGIVPASPWEMRLDPVSRILYTANRCGGLWAQRLP